MNSSTVNAHSVNKSSNLYPTEAVRKEIKEKSDMEQTDMEQTESLTPLIVMDTLKPKIAEAESDVSNDETQTEDFPYPGVEEDFFQMSSRADFPAGNTTDHPDGVTVAIGNGVHPIRPLRSERDFEMGSIMPDLETIPDVNVYQQKKTLAQGMMDLALFSANANQLRYVLESSDRHPYFYPSVVFISISLLFQVAVGAGLIWNARYNVKDDKDMCIANKINNFTIIGVFLVTVINVFISAFGVASSAPLPP